MSTHTSTHREKLPKTGIHDDGLRGHGNSTVTAVRQTNSHKRLRKTSTEPERYGCVETACNVESPEPGGCAG